MPCSCEHTQLYIKIDNETNKLDKYFSRIGPAVRNYMEYQKRRNMKTKSTCRTRYSVAKRWRNELLLWANTKNNESFSIKQFFGHSDCPRKMLAEAYLNESQFYQWFLDGRILIHRYEKKQKNNRNTYRQQINYKIFQTQNNK